MNPSHPSESREEMARREIGRTDITRRQALALVLGFLLVIVLIPLHRNLRDLREYPVRALPSLKIFTHSGDVAAAYHHAPSGGWTARLFNANRHMLRYISEYETALKEDSAMAQALIPPIQGLTIRFLGLGNERAYPGKDGWLFFRDGVDSLTGPGFLDPDHLRRRAAGGSEWQPPPAPDPRPAIFAFHAYLQSRGIELVLMPVPVKPSLHPDRLSSRYGAAAPVIRNPSFAGFADEMRRHGIPVFDAAPHLKQFHAETGHPPFLKTDTHWTAAAMAYTAAALAEKIKPALSQKSTSGTPYTFRNKVTLSHTGDIVENLLRLKNRGVYPEEEVTIRPVMLDEAKPWEADVHAEVLFLGDSFANIYSEPNMGWGESAGLAEQLSHALQAPVDAVIRNDAGAHATRMALAAELPRTDRLHGKKVVVWEFAARELAVGDWKPVDWTRIQPGPPPTEIAVSTARKTLSGIIIQVTAPPRPGTVAYKDCIIQAHLKVEKGEPGEPEVVINVWGMKNNQWTKAAQWKAGQQLTAPLEDWDGVSKKRKLDRIKTIPLDDPDFELFDLPVYWMEK